MDPSMEIDEVCEEIIINFERDNNSFIKMFRNILNSLSTYDIKNATEQLFRMEEIYNQDKHLLVKNTINKMIIK